MNQTDIEINSKRRVVQLSATFFMCLLAFASCEKEESNIGDTLHGEGLNVIQQDTFSILTYSEEIDSMESDETSVNLLGQYNDPAFGNVDCGFATQIRLSSANPSFAANTADVIVDSVVLGLSFATINYYGTPTDPVTFEVYELTEDLVREDQDYYTFQTPNTGATNLVLAGSETQTPDFVGQQIVGDDTLNAHLRIHLDPATIGQDLVNINGNGEMATDEQFVNAFKGLYIKVNGAGLSNNQGAIWYFSLENSLSKVTIFFHEVSDPATKEYGFSINSAAARYNVLNTDRSGTRVESVLNDPSLGQEEFYTQGSAIWSVIEFPHIMSLNYDQEGKEDRKIINRAQLILPVQDYTADYFDPSVSLFLARVIDKRTSDFTLDYSFSSTLAGNTVKYDQDEKEYRFEMTKEIQAILDGSRENTGYRIYSPAFYSSTVERVIFNGPNSPLKNKARLEVTYTDY